LIAKFATIFVAIAIVAGVTATMLVPRIATPPSPPTLLDKTVILTDQNYDVGYPLTLSKGESIEVKASGNDQPIDFRITDNQSSTLIEELGNTFYDVSWTVPVDGTYIFYMSAPVGEVTATLIVLKS